MRTNVLSEITLPDMSGGLNTRSPEYQIADNQSPDMLNLWYKDKALVKRPGQETVAGFGAKVHSISEEFSGLRAVHAGAKLYLWDEAGAKSYRGTFSPADGYPEGAESGDYYTADAAGTVAGTEYAEGDRALYDGAAWYKAVWQIADGIADAQSVFVTFGDMLYLLDGSEIWEINGSFEVEAAVPYEPVVMINTRPDLSESTDNEPYNLIGAGFTVKYNGNGTSTVYKLPWTDLDNTTVKVVIDAQDVTSGFTVNKAAADNATVTFSTAPPSGTNNVWITAYKTTEGNKERITGCRAAIAFGGESSGLSGGSRVFVTANPAYPLSYWRSDIGLHISAGMRYFPDTAEERLDQTGGAVTAAAKMGGELVIFKKDSIYALSYSFDGQDVYYPVRACSSSVGCDMPGSVQLIDNRLVFANTRSGVNMLISTNNTMEDIVKPISANINRQLLGEHGLTEACSCDYERYYWLKAGEHVYLWDYEGTPYYNYSDYEKAQSRLAWYRFGGIDADMMTAGGTLCCASGSGITAFKRNRDDFGSAFPAYFTSKAFDLGCPETLKTFMYVYPSFSSDGSIVANVTVSSEDTDEVAARDFDLRSFRWHDFNWAAHTWESIKFARTFKMRLGMKKVSYIQVKVSSDEADRGMGLAGLKITYFINRKVKG